MTIIQVSSVRNSVEYYRFKKLVEELLKLPQVGKKELAVKLVDIMPRVPDEVRIIYAKEKYTLTQEQIEEILEIINKYRI